MSLLLALLPGLSKLWRAVVMYGAMGVRGHVVSSCCACALRMLQYVAIHLGL